MISDANKAVNDLASIVPLLGGSSSRKDYAPPAFPFRVFPVCCLLSVCFLFFSLL
ncbi:putative DNA-binding protein [Klebsiella pneumoniae]|uniref:Putative DNA-binding protein n=1 Tax=Klebsiella pneumoniae subsp. ozaenae TaxID=574 RepID=A0A378UFG4_KLEPO|nr:putative DNA-binding protein [Klebsiella pneumoniae]STZ75231.1 putative DNA-binding protein [Klebsiella pneumoniae subsp. ozaenae]